MITDNVRGNENTVSTCVWGSETKCEGNGIGLEQDNCVGDLPDVSIKVLAGSQTSKNSK